MDIKADDMMELLNHLDDALRKEHQWMGFDAQLSKVTARDIDCFKDKAEAENFYKDELKSDHSIIPIEPVWFIVQDLSYYYTAMNSVPWIFISMHRR